MTARKITLHILIDGGEIRGVVGADTSAGVSQINAQATIHLTSRPGQAVEGADVEIWAGFDGDADIIFKGQLDGTTWEFFPGVVSLPARDLLARTRYDWGGEDREYIEQDDAAIIRNLLEAMGIPSSQAHIESSGWTLGVVQSVIAPGGRAFWPLVAEIDSLAGFRTYTDRAGIIRRYQVSGNIGIGSSFNYSNGANVIKIVRRRSLDGIVNKAVVTGLTYEGLQVGGPGVAEAQADNPFVPNPPRYITEAIQSNLVEDDAKALEIAIRTVRDKNRRPETFEITIAGERRMQPLSIIQIAQPELEVASGRVIVDRVQHSIRAEPPSFQTVITTLGGTVDATATNIPPVAAFDLKLFREGEDTGSGVSTIITGVADGSASSDPDGAAEDLTFAWEAEVDAGTVTPASGSGPVYRFAIEGAATSVTVTLTVTDPGGAEGTLTRTLALTSGSMLIEPLYLALDGVIKASADGEQTWSAFTVDGEACLAPFAPDWGEIWGDGGGEIWASIDKLATPAVSLGTPHGAVACTAVWINEEDTTRLWAAFDDGAVYAGTIDPIAVTATWTLAGTVPEGPVREIRESVGALGDLRATAGAGYYHSSDGGATWSLLHIFDVAWRMTAGFGLNLASGLNSDPPLFEEEGAAPTVEGSPTHIRGLSFGWRQQELYATDDAAQLYLSDATFTPLALQTDALPAQGNHMIRSGNVDRVVYIACGDGTGGNSGAVKWMPEVKAPWYIHKTDDTPVLMIGYGPASPPFSPVAVLMVPYGGSGATDKIWRYTPGIGWEGITPPQSGWYWFGIAASPFNRLSYLLWGNDDTDTHGYSVASGIVKSKNGGGSPLYRTDDGGATWTEIDLGTDDKTEARDNFFAVWSEDTPDLWCASLVLDKPLAREQVCFWRNGTGASSVPLTGRLGQESSGRQNHALASGVGGEFVFSIKDAAEYVVYVTATGTSEAGSPQPLDGAVVSLDRLPASSRALAALGGVLASDDGTFLFDYHSVADFQSIVADAGTVLTAADDAVFVGGRTGILQIDNIATGPANSIVPGTEGTFVGHIRAGRALRKAVATRKGGAGVTDLFVRSNGIWSTLTGPPDATAETLQNFVEVIDGPEAEA